MSPTAREISPGAPEPALGRGDRADVGGGSPPAAPSSGLAEDRGISDMAAWLKGISTPDSQMRENVTARRPSIRGPARHRHPAVEDTSKAVPGSRDCPLRPANCTV